MLKKMTLSPPQYQPRLIIFFFFPFLTFLLVEELLEKSYFTMAVVGNIAIGDLQKGLLFLFYLSRILPIPR